MKFEILCRVSFKAYLREQSSPSKKIEEKKGQKIREFPGIINARCLFKKYDQAQFPNKQDRGHAFLRGLNMRVPEDYNQQSWIYKRKEGIIIIVIATIIFILYFTLKDRPAGAPPQEQKDSVVNKDTTRITS